MPTDDNDELKRILKDLPKVIDFALRVSMALRGRPTTTAGESASIIHTKMTINAISAERVSTNNLFDHSAVISICRMVMEAMTLYFYLSEAVDADQWQCRELVLRLHDTSARIKLMRGFKEEQDYEDLLTGKASLRSEIQSNSFFRTLPPKQQKTALAGGQIYIGGMTAAATRAAGWQEKRYLSFYNYFSAHSHSAPMSFMRFGKHNINFSEPSEAQRGAAATVLNVAACCLLRVTMHYLRTAPDAERSFEKSEIKEFEKQAIEQESMLRDVG